MDNEDAKRLAAHGERIRKSGALGKSSQLNRLFDLLLERSIADAAPKEIEIAQTVFGKSTDVDLAADATVRVHVHRLRKKLEELPADGHGERLALPRGEYRLVIVPSDVADTNASPGAPRRLSRCSWMWFVWGAIFVVGLNLIGWLYLTKKIVGDGRLDSALWTALAGSHNPTLIVYGDEYVFGVLDANKEVAQMIIDPSVNTPDELDQYKLRTPGANAKYIDLNTYTIPEGVAPAMAAITPIIAAARSGELPSLQSIAMSRFTNNMLRTHDLVYLGLLKNLRDLKEPLCDISGFSLSADGDTLVDRASGTRYQSDWDNPSTEGIMRRDYAYLASFPGSSGNHIVVIAGTRDPALMEAIQIASNKLELDKLSARLGPDNTFEALYEVRTFGPSNVGNRPIIVRHINVNQMWPVRDSRLAMHKAATSNSVENKPKQ
ncbi:winged helix-turn-helix domain-containing protein [Burkholderia multivorans]|uniref:winged helix-turn-helix domain-containing protein n=1 Tax=Burkholderia multivorans TaxID=87883 RepID=UPI0020193374|nr:helix-turn-helix domain-containing protein [Burkholderia multivorans]MCA8143554.1 hypothetical protein [Burkholderia multivorans]MCO1368564.1 hypothetical protein [Burkholderia multivorans]MCO1380455.1 hypothetical protein [Burkholderia multivorans]UQP21436.1 hypothetical protein L0Y98_18415 [Burkholderia multivorans]UQP92118.1 hypothetical protein L0Y91_28850 [Burkholderia multivorans]